MQIQGHKRKRSQACIGNNTMTQGGLAFLGVGVCLLVWSYFSEDEHFAVLTDYPNIKFSISSLLYEEEPSLHHRRHKQTFDFELGPAVERAKYFGFANRDSNQGHNISDWNLLATSVCNAQQEEALLSDMEIYTRKLPKAILLGVQKGGTTALSKYLFKHEGIERTEKELYVLDEAMDNHFFKQMREEDTVTTTSIPRKRGRDIYSQSTLGITYKLARRQKREKENGLAGTKTNSVEETLQKEEKRKEDLKLLARRRIRHTRRMVYKAGDGDAPRPRQLSEEEEKDTSRNIVAIETLAPTIYSWDPDAKMRRYFGGRKAAFEMGDKKSRTMTLDMTPNYMLHSDRIPARIECLVPWVKLFCILRNPIDRAVSQYDMKMRVVKNGKNNKGKDIMNSSTSLVNSWGNPVPTLDEFVLNDLEVLYEVGVLQDWTRVDFESFWQSPECWHAWQKYIHLGLNAPIGMGLYAIQLKPFLDMLQRVHSENAMDYFMALDNQDLRDDPDVTYNRLLKFLDLGPLTLSQYRTTINQSRGHAGSKYEVLPATKERIQAAIKPYNLKLGELLGEEWGTKWS